jgi:hypothetical protein
MSRAPKSESPEPFVITQIEPKRPSGRAVLFAGVAAAGVLGVSLGLWARPQLHEGPMAQASEPKAAAAARRLEIVVSDHPRAAAAAPIEVLPPGAAGAPAPAPRFAPNFSPLRPPEGLMKAHDEAPPVSAPAHASPLKAVLPEIAAAFAGAKLALARFEHPAPPAEPVLAEDDHRAELSRAQQRELEIARADADRAEAHRAALAKAAFDDAEAAKAKAAKLKAAQARAAEARAEEAQAREEAREARIAKAEAAKAAAAKVAAAKAEAHRIALAKAEARADAKAEARAEAHRQALAKAETAKAEAAEAAAHKLELARAAKAEKAEHLRLAKAEARAKAAQAEEARLEKLAQAAEAKKRIQLARLAHAAIRAVTGREDPPPDVEPAKLDKKHRHEVQMQQAALKKRHAPPARAAAHGRGARSEPLPPPPDSGLMKVSSPRCASSDPGEAMTCADPSLTAADRQLTRAYQGARAAGVPDGRLQAGQERWLAARAAAAREAPWALHDVYMARIAELNGQAKEAQGGY